MLPNKAGRIRERYSSGRRADAQPKEQRLTRRVRPTKNTTLPINRNQGGGGIFGVIRTPAIDLRPLSLNLILFRVFSVFRGSLIKDLKEDNHGLPQAIAALQSLYCRAGTVADLLAAAFRRKMEIMKLENFFSFGILQLPVRYSKPEFLHEH